MMLIMKRKMCSSVEMIQNETFLLNHDHLNPNNSLGSSTDPCSISLLQSLPSEDVSKDHDMCAIGLIWKTFKCMLISALSLFFFSFSFR